MRTIFTALVKPRLRTWPGRNLKNGEEIPGKITDNLEPGDVLTIETPGGGGWGHPDSYGEKE